jgi:hypothetical protein
LNDCAFDPPIDASQAEGIWAEYRARAEAIPERPPALPVHLPLNSRDQIHAQKFMRFLNSKGAHDIGSVIKVDLSQLAVVQYVVVTERAENYAPIVANDDGWRHECLPLKDPTPTNLRASVSRTGPNGLSTEATIDVPHSEHAFLPDPTGTAFTVTQFLRHVTAVQGGNRLYLKAGYHRSFAKVLSVPVATVPSAMVALVSNTFTPAPIPVNAAAGLTTGTAGLDPFGLRAAVLRDFFTDGLFMDVLLRKKRYQLQVRSTWVAIDDPN